MYKQFSQQLIRALFVLFIPITVYLLCMYTLPYIYPFLIAFIIAFTIQPVVNFLQFHLRFPRIIATITVMLVCFTLLFGIIFMILTELIQGTVYLANQLPSYYQTFISQISDIIHHYTLKITSIFKNINPQFNDTFDIYVKQMTNYVGTTGANMLRDMLFQIPSTLLLIPTSVTVFIFIGLATFFFTKDWNYFKRRAFTILPQHWRKNSSSVFRELKHALFGYLKAQVILICISSVIILFGLLILQIEHALTIALFATVADILPLIGTGIIFIPWILYLFFTGNYPLTISLAILYMIVIITRQLLEPKILSANIGINPLLGLFVLFVSMQMWGLSGIVLAPIILICIVMLVKLKLFHTIWHFIKGNSSS